MLVTMGTHPSAQYPLTPSDLAVNSRIASFLQGKDEAQNNPAEEDDE